MLKVVGSNGGEATGLGSEGTFFTRDDAPLLMIYHCSSVQHVVPLHSQLAKWAPVISEM